MSPADDRDASADPVVVLSHRLWQRRFGGDPSVLGTTITLDGHDFNVIGVTPASAFAGIKVGTPRDRVGAARGAAPDRSRQSRRGSNSAGRHGSRCSGGSQPGVTLEQARAELSAIAAAIGTNLSGHQRPRGRRRGAGPGPRRRTCDERLRRFAYLPLAAVGIVLLIACANVAGLLLARPRPAARRLRHGSRSVPGASASSGNCSPRASCWRPPAALAGLAHRELADDAGCAACCRTGISSCRSISIWASIGACSAFMLGVATATGVLFGLVPALQGSRPDLVPAMKADAVPNERRDLGLRSVLVVAQLALSVILLVAAGLCVRTLRNAAAIDTGYEASAVLTARHGSWPSRTTAEARGRPSSSNCSNACTPSRVSRPPGSRSRCP